MRQRDSKATRGGLGNHLIQAFAPNSATFECSAKWQLAGFFQLEALKCLFCCGFLSQIVKVVRRNCSSRLVQCCFHLASPRTDFNHVLCRPWWCRAQWDSRDPQSSSHQYWALSTWHHRGFSLRLGNTIKAKKTLWACYGNRRGVCWKIHFLRQPGASALSIDSLEANEMVVSELNPSVPQIGIGYIRRARGSDFLPGLRKA